MLVGCADARADALEDLPRSRGQREQRGEGDGGSGHILHRVPRGGIASLDLGSLEEGMARLEREIGETVRNQPAQASDA